MPGVVDPERAVEQVLGKCRLKFRERRLRRIPAAEIEPSALEELAGEHRRETS